MPIQAHIDRAQELVIEINAAREALFQRFYSPRVTIFGVDYIIHAVTSELDMLDVQISPLLLRRGQKEVISTLACTVQAAEDILFNLVHQLRGAGINVFDFEKGDTW